MESLQGNVAYSLRLLLVSAIHKEFSPKLFCRSRGIVLEVLLLLLTPVNLVKSSLNVQNPSVGYM